SDSLRGLSPLLPRNEPLATYYFSGALSLFGVRSYSEFLDGFFFAELVLGIGFIVILFLLAREIFEDPTARLQAFLLLLVLPYGQLFFGYVEVYSVVLVALSLYMLAAARYLNGRLPFPATMWCFVLLVLTHFISALLLPSVLYL